jgi:hypothetical protein
MAYPTISLCALKLINDLPTQTYYVMKFPARLQEYIKTLQSKLYKSDEPRNPPTKSLYQALHLIPGLIYIGKINEQNSDDFWLYSFEALQEDNLYIILKEWLQTEFSKKFKGNEKITFEEELEEIFNLLEGTLVWEKRTINYPKTFKIHANNTANISSNDYILLPYIVGNQLSQNDCIFHVKDEQLKFYRTVSSYKRGNMQLISWPPLRKEYKKHNYYYSIVLNLGLILIPGQTYPQLHISPSIRRWISSKSQLSRHHDTTAYIFGKNNWVKRTTENLKQTYREVFLSCKMTWDGKEKMGKWDENLGELLKQLNILHLPASHILNHPAKVIEECTYENKIQPMVAMTYKDGMPSNHYVAKKFSTDDTIDLFQQICQVLSSDWEPIQYNRIDIPRKYTPKIANFWDLPLPLPNTDYQLEFDGQLNKLETDDNLFKQQNIIRQAIARCIKDKHLTIWLWYIEEENLKERLKAIRYCFGLPIDCLEMDVNESYQYCFTEEGLTICVVCQEVGAFAEPLEIDPKDNISKKQDTIYRRTQEIVDWAKINKHKMPGKTVVWFELYDKEHWTNTNDPKLAIRLGFAQAGMVSQFITPTEEKSKIADDNYQYKSIKCIGDLLRALGITLENPPLVLQQINSDHPITITNQVGLYLIRRTSKTTGDGNNLLIPVMVRKDEFNQITAIFPPNNSNDQLDWQPYHQALVNINNKGKGYKNNDKDKGQIRNWIKTILQKKELRNKNTILYCDSENSRKVWKWLRDININQEGLSFADGDEQNFQKFPGLRLVRVRLKGNNETPEWFAKEKDKKSGHVTGLFQHPEKLPVFYSLPNKPPTMSKYLNNFSRIKTPNKEWQHSQIVEFTIGYHQENDNLESLAMIAHNSRKGILQYGDSLKVPQILHYAKLMKEYVLMLNSEDTENSD